MKEEGMTLRNWYAGQALSAYSGIRGQCTGTSPEKIAEMCFVLADAMIAESNVATSKVEDKNAGN